MESSSELAELITVPREVEAQLIVDALAEKGVPAHHAGGETAGFRAEAPGDVVIYVKQEDHDRAVRAYAEIREEAEHIDWSQVDFGTAET